MTRQGRRIAATPAGRLVERIGPGAPAIFHVRVPPQGEPIWYGRGQDANGAKRTAYLGHENIIGYADHYVQSTERHPHQHLAATSNEDRY